MLNRYGSNHEPAPQLRNESWLVNGQDQLLVRFSEAQTTDQGQWVLMSTYRWIRPDPPVPQTRRRMLRQNAIEAWQNMLKVGWRRCHPPVR